MKAGAKSAILLLIFFFLCMALSFYVSHYKLVIYPIDGQSMEPNVHHEDKVLVFRTQNIKQGDVVIIESQALNEVLIKRVIGLGGDVIAVKYNVEQECFEIWRNGKLLEEEYIKEKITSSSYKEGEIVVPEGHIYYLGDNRNVSGDCHSINATEDSSLVVGKVIMRYNGFDIKFKLSATAKQLYAMLFGY